MLIVGMAMLRLFIWGFVFLHETGCDKGTVPVGGNVDGLEVWAFIHHRLLADAHFGFGEAVGGENVEVGVFFEPGLQVLRGNEVIRVVDCRPSRFPPLIRCWKLTNFASKSKLLACSTSFS